MGAGTLASDAGRQTNGTTPSTNSTCYICEFCMSQISIGKLKFIACEYRLGEIAHWPSPNERPHLPHVGYMAFSKSILKAGDSLLFQPFIDGVLLFFIVVLFQLTSNSYCIIVTFYIAFTEACRFEPSAGHFVMSSRSRPS